jgi:5S rRNA maturation endonuclease (ribonuclease M5)
LAQKLAAKRAQHSSGGGLHRELIERNPLPEYLRSRGYELRESGESLVTSACPVEAHKKPGHRPVSIDVTKQVWYCNDHKVGGSVIDWEATEKRISIAAAIQSLNGEYKVPAKQFVCAYDYTDENGAVLFRKLRFKVPPPKMKTFGLRQPDGRGGWIKNIDGVRRVLYHLSTILAAQQVIVVEGEKDADTVTAQGFVSTTNFDGAGKWLAEYSEALRGKDVIVMADNDKDGDIHRPLVGSQLLGIARSVRVAKVPEQFKDISDYLESLPQADRRAAIQRLIDGSEEFKPASLLTLPYPQDLTAQEFTFDDLMAFDSKHDPNCLVGNRYLVRGGSSLWAGGSGYGKSSLELQLAVYWACGVPCFGLRPVRPLKSLIIQAENDLGDMGEQLQGVIAGIEASGDLDVEERRDLIKKNLVIRRAIGKSGTLFLAMLDVLIEMDRPDFIWIDPLFAFAGCDLTNAAATGRFIRDGLMPIADKRMVALNVIHHVGKPVRDPQAKKSAFNMAEIDFQYLGFGTSEVQNAFRAVNILVPVGNTGIFRLVLSKRGERAGARDVSGEWCRSIYLEHSKTGICWLQCEKPDKETAGAAKLKYVETHILNQMSVAYGFGAGELQKKLKEETGMSAATFYRLWDGLKTAEKIRLNAEEKWIKK